MPILRFFKGKGNFLPVVADGIPPFLPVKAIGGLFNLRARGGLDHRARGGLPDLRTRAPFARAQSA
jgi:hypothetical protein